MNRDKWLPTRHSLINRLKNWEDRESWQDFFDTYWRLIYSVATKAGLNDSEAQDVVQETVLTVAKKIHEFQTGRERGSFKAWLLTATRWRIQDQFRKRRGDVVAAPAPPASPSETDRRTATVERVPDPASLDFQKAWDRDWEENLFEAALERVKKGVKPAVMQMFMLHAIKRWPAQRVATFLGVSMGQVYFAKAKVSDLLQKEVHRLEKQVV